VSTVTLICCAKTYACIFPYIQRYTLVPILSEYIFTLCAS